MCPFHKGGDGSFDGEIDELSIFGRAISPKEVQVHVGDRLTGAERGLLVYYRFDEGHGFVTKDFARSLLPFRTLASTMTSPEIVNEIDHETATGSISNGNNAPIQEHSVFSLHLDAELGSRTSENVYAPSWIMSTCPLKPCHPHCSGHGVCWKGICKCLPGWRGHGCQQSECPFACSGHGECILFSEKNQRYRMGGTMKDRLAAFGLDLEDLVHNASGAVAKATGSQAITALAASLSKTVSKSLVSKVPNLHNGTLDKILFPSLGSALHHVLEATKQYVCLCENGYAPPSCTDKICTHSCGHGRCNKDGVCVCNHGWVGSQCEKRQCLPHPTCSNNGNCVNGTCQCFAGWMDDDCSVRDVCPNDCSGLF